MLYRITERLIVDDEVGFEADIERCVDLINSHRNVAVGTLEEAVEVLRGLGFTDASIAILFQTVRAYALPW